MFVLKLCMQTYEIFHGFWFGVCIWKCGRGENGSDEDIFLLSFYLWLFVGFIFFLLLILYEYRCCFCLMFASVLKATIHDGSAKYFFFGWDFIYSNRKIILNLICNFRKLCLSPTSTFSFYIEINVFRCTEIFNELWCTLTDQFHVSLNFILQLFNRSSEDILLK